MEEKKILSIRLLSTAKATDRIYDYLCPETLFPKRGDLVKIPFGKGNREQYGIVLEVRQEAPQRECKEILSVFPPEYALGEEMLDLCEHLRSQIFCTFGDAARAILPSPVYKKAAKSVRCLAINAKTDPETALSSFSGKNKEKYLALLRFLQTVKQAEAVECEKRFGISSSSLRLLEQKEVVFFCEKEEMRNSFADLLQNAAPVELVLSKEQENAFSELKELAESGKAQGALLYGVTGSGKTSVMLALIDFVLSQGKNVIFLVPEIALTSQSARLLVSRYGNEVAILHSALSEGERRDAILAIGKGKKRIVLGTRSAIFAPLEHIGLIVIDEEQDSSYKSDTALKYHARDVARFRAARHGALLLLASATPDIESYYKAKNDKYHLVTLKNRYGASRLPEVGIIDIRRDLRNNPSCLIGERLHAEIQRNLDAGEQTILLMNRRGYRKFVSCMQCGTALRCPHCSVTLTVHNGKNPRLVCHYCGYTAPLPENCPECGGAHLALHGYGIQHLEEQLAEKFPQARVLRMDSDTVTGKGSLDEILNRFQSGDADVLIGTQMVAKGHNFPNVTLVGIVFADTSLYTSDYRAYEHTYSLLTQVIGRAGRAEKPGRALIQTLNPRHNVFSLAARQDYEEFYEGEIALRKSFLFPPFCELAVFTLADEDEARLLLRAKRLADQLSTQLAGEFQDVSLVVYGPFDATVYKIRGIYRKRFILKFKNTRRTRALFENILITQSDPKDRQAKLTLDINPGMI